MRAVVAFSLITACSRAPDPTPVPDARVPVDAATCLETWTIEDHNSLLAEQRRRGSMPDFQDIFRATAITPEHRPVELLADVRVGGEPLLWFPPDGVEAFVDARVFSELRAVDLPGLRPGARARVGSITSWARSAGIRSAAVKGGEGRALLDALLRAGVLRSFWHIGAELCLAAETTADTYTAEIRGEHTYFTSERNVEPIAVRFELTADGQIRVSGLPL